MPYNLRIEGAASSAPGVATQKNSSSRAVAPVWHTVVVLLALLGLSAAGAISPQAFPLGGWRSRAAGYTFVMVFEWVVAAFIARSVRSRGTGISDLVGGSWAYPRDFLRDLGIAVLFLLVCGFGVVTGLRFLLQATANAGMHNMLPHNGLEMTVWLLMSLTAGFCEELIFRGYLQRQFEALTNSVWAAIALQGIAFGASHGYQGHKLMLVIAVYGSLFGVLAHWRRSLRPGMLAHFMQDGLGGLVGRYWLR